MSPIAIVIIIFLIVIIMLLSGKVPIPAAAIFCAVSLQATGILSASQAWAGFSNTTSVMFAGMFVVAAGLAKTNLLSKLTTRFFKPGNTDRQIVIGLLVMVLLLGLFTNATVIITLMLPIIYQVSNETNRPASRFIAPVAQFAMVSAGFVPLGGNSGSYMGWNSIVENLGGVATFGFFTSFIAKAPIVIACFIYMVLIGYKFAPTTPAYAVDTTAFTNTKDKKSTLSPQKEKIARAIFILTIVGVVSAAITHWTEIYIVAVFGALLMVFTGVLSQKEAFNAIQWPVIFIFAGMLPLSTALAVTGADSVVAGFIQNILGGTTNSYVIMGAFFLVSLTLTQVMSNVAVAETFKPLAATVAIAMGFDPRACMLATIMGATVATTTPMASPSQSIAFSGGGYSMKQYFLSGFPLVLVYFITFMIYVPLVFPAT